jgi:anaerobic magnesium-protoporphyrin IX monomethyl ester cyclase
MNRITLLEPRAVIDGRPVQFLRDVFGGEVPLSCPYPPLELAFCAAVLREAELPVELIPANVLGLDHDRVAAMLAADPPAMVVVPSAWGSLSDDLDLLRRLRTALPQTRLVLFGPNVTATPAPTLGTGAVDVVIIGEPEEAVLRLAQGEDPAAVPNLAFLQGGELVRTEQRFPPNWARYPLPARDLLPLAKYTIPFARRHPCTTMVTTRGCPSACNFCPTHLWHRRTVRPRPIPLVMAEIDELVGRYGMREIVIRDDTFTWDRDRVVAFCDALLDRDHDLTWRCFATVDTVDPELLRTMAAAGCTQVCFGFESGDDALLARTGKNTTAQQGVDAARWVHAAGMEVSGTFLVGLEGETHETIARSIAFAKATRLDYVQVNVATPLPGTGFGKRHERRGGEARHDSFRWVGAHTGRSEALSPEALSTEAKRFYRDFYLRPRYVIGRLRSRRGIGALWAHARLGSRMVWDTMR